METKSCNRCKQFFPATSEYFPTRKKRNGQGVYLRENCRKCTSAQKIESQRRNKEAYNIRQKRWRDNGGSEKLRHRYATDEIFREDRKRNALLWPKKNPEAFKAIQKRREERMKAIGGDISKELKIEIWLDQEERCAYCGITLQFQECETDHLLAVSRGGTNERDNLRVACETCNCSKGTKTLEEWQAVRGW